MPRKAAVDVAQRDACGHAVEHRGEEKRVQLPRGPQPAAVRRAYAALRPTAYCPALTTLTTLAAAMQEDQRLVELVNLHGPKKWSQISIDLGTNKGSKQVRPQAACAGWA